MNPRERVEAVYAGETPDQVPLLLDLSHWYKKNYNKEFNLAGYQTVDQGLVDLHNEIGAVCYVEMGRFYDLLPTNNLIKMETKTKNGRCYTSISTPEGSIYQERIFNHTSYSYSIRKNLIESVEDFPVILCLMKNLACIPRWKRFFTWQNALGNIGYPYCQLPSSGLGYLISKYFGVQNTIYAHIDFPEKVKELIEAVNQCNLRILEKIIDGPFQTLFFSDNYDSTIQTKELFYEYSRTYYTEVAERLHAKGKYLAVHVDGEMRGVVKWLAECGVDCIDAATPAPMFALTPDEARKQAGNDIILSGGIPATVFGSNGTDEEFTASVRKWLDTRHISPRLFMAAGDQVPTDAPLRRIKMLPKLVEKYGSY